MKGSMTRLASVRTRLGFLVAAAVVAGAVSGLLVVPTPAVAQGSETGAGEWRYIGGDAGHTRYSGLDQITADNFENLEVAWVWRGDNYGPNALGRLALDPDLRRRHPLHRRRRAP